MIIEFLRPWRRQTIGSKLDTADGVGNILVRRGIAREVQDGVETASLTNTRERPQRAKRKTRASKVT